MRENRDLYDELTIDSLSDDMKMVAKSCGMEVVVSLLDNLPGISLNVPKSIPKEIIKDYIKKKL